jgi:endo-1,4-beta-xylanase
MDALPRRRALRWLAVPAAAVLAAVAAVAVVSPAHAQASTLRNAAGSQMLVGVATTPNLINTSQHANLNSAHFSSITAENHMKMDTVQPNQGQFNFGPGNQLINWANQNNQHVYGHTLVWHSQAPGWIQNQSGTQLDQSMQTHITTVMQQWPSIQRWDVVNEAVSDNNGQLRQSFWLNNHPEGAGYIENALQYARAANPNANLCLNDYSIDGINAKSNRYFTMVQDFLQRGVPIDCMGFQAHLISGQVPGDMAQNLNRFKNLGLEVWVTELDVRMPVGNQNLQQQAQDFQQVFDICYNQVGCAGLTVWGLHDGQSWVDSTFPEYDSPLLWNDNYQPKPAFNAVLNLLNGSNPPPSSPPPPPPPSSSAPPPPPPSSSAPPPPPPPGGCSVNYQADNWGGDPGFTANVNITNNGGSTISGWQLVWNYTAGQTVTPPGWNGTVSQSGSTVTGVNASWNANIFPGQTVNIGFNGRATSIGNNPDPTSFTLNGTPCSS